MSKSRKILNHVLEAVSCETEVSIPDILLRCSKAEVVDARWICVKCLSEYGYYPSRISEMMGLTPRYVQYIITDFENRISLNKLMRTNYERIKSILRISAEITIWLP